MSVARRFAAALVAAGLGAGLAAQTPQPAQQPTPAQPKTNLGADPNGNPLRLAIKTGHVSNYDESKVRPYTLPDPLVRSNGARVANADAWRKDRRPEILRQYETEIYGHLPAGAPAVAWRVAETDAAAREGAAVMKRIVGRMGDPASGPEINVALYTPAKAKGRVPVILLINFGGGPPPPPGSPAGGRGGPPMAMREPPVAAEILAKGWGYAMVGYGDIQPDRANAWDQGVLGLSTRRSDGTREPDGAGTISAWAWGVSRVIDYLETDAAVDGRRIAVQRHSRLGKTVLWASALDERIAGVFSSCSGEMGAALARRDWGETVDDMAQNFAWQFSENFQKWVGRWNEMPVDAHMLIALSAPRPVFVTGGTTDQWADPAGEFLALVEAGPVYRLLGKKDVGASELPPLDTPLTGGELGWHYHTGGHTATPEDWKAFLAFMAKYWS